MAGAIALVMVGAPCGVVAFFAALAVIAAVDLVVIARRKHRGEPG